MALDPQKRVRGPLLQNSRGSAETSPISTEPGLGTRSPQPQSPRSLEAGPPREGRASRHLQSPQEHTP